MNESLSRRVISVTKLKDATVLALCEDGSMWVGRVSKDFTTKWKRVTDIPKVGDE